MTKATQEKALKDLNQAIKELSTARNMLTDGIMTQSLIDEIYNWLGTGTLAATAAKDTVYEETTYKDKY